MLCLDVRSIASIYPSAPSHCYAVGYARSYDCVIVTAWPTDTRSTLPHQSHHPTMRMGLLSRAQLATKAATALCLRLIRRVTTMWLPVQMGMSPIVSIRYKVYSAYCNSSRFSAATTRESPPRLISATIQPATWEIETAPREKTVLPYT
jgi:hypothetical protein